MVTIRRRHPRRSRRSRPKPKPHHSYSIIYADPPWAYRDKRAREGKVGRGGAVAYYRTMKLPDVKALPISRIAADDSILFMWATFPNLQPALDVIASWGFKYKTIGFNWVKLNKKSATPFIGVGHYTRSNSEVCLIGTRGQPTIVSHSVSSVILSPIREHSRKPDEARDRIVQLCGDVPRIELFSRERVEGWHAWGDEVDCDIDLVS